MLQKLSSAAVVIGALRVNFYFMSEDINIMSMPEGAIFKHLPLNIYFGEE